MNGGDAFVEAIAKPIAEAVVMGLKKRAACTQRLMEFKQAAAYLGQSEEVFRHEIDCGHIPVVRIDRKMRFDCRDLDRYQSGLPPKAPEIPKDERALDLAVAAIRRKPRYTSSVIYFVACGENAVKIGCSREGMARIRTLQTANPNPLKLLAILPGDYRTEAALHRAFADFRLSGEWFQLGGPVKQFLKRVRAGGMVRPGDAT